MSNRFLTPKAVMAFVLREIDGKPSVLLHRRLNTGYADGMWDCGASGHVEEGESMRAAMAREAMEELGITVAVADIQFAVLQYGRYHEDDETYVDVFFIIERYEGTPRIVETHKSSALQWFALDALPDTLLPDRRRALDNYLAGVPFDEFGFPC